MRKSSILLAIICAAIGMTGCLTSEVHYTPQIQLSKFVRDVSDTLPIRYNSDDAYYYLDSIYPGDSIRFAVAYDAIGNQLMHTNLKYDTEALRLSANLKEIANEIDSARSDVKAFDITYKPNEYRRAVIIGVTMHPKKVGDSKLHFRIDTDSKFSPTELTLSVRVREKK